MKVEIQDSFSEKLGEVVDLISKDKPKAAHKFRTEILNRINDIPKYPFHCKKSIYFNNELIRDMVFKGYTIVYRVDEAQNIILVFGLI